MIPAGEHAKIGRENDMHWIRRLYLALETTLDVPTYAYQEGGIRTACRPALGESGRKQEVGGERRLAYDAMTFW